MFQFLNTALAAAKIITLPSFDDDRGNFTKMFHKTMLQENGIEFDLKESYFSVSKKNVIRGMHFQTPPHHHAKIVCCPKGAILDVLLDLRKDSPTYGQFISQVLSEENHKAFYIPKGFAHGFLSLTEDAVTYYLVSSEYSKEHDTGILYNSFGFDWGVAHPVLSVRDLGFDSFKNWQSPF